VVLVVAVLALMVDSKAETDYAILAVAQVALGVAELEQQVVQV
jgi:hypothetical protein